MIRIQNIVFLSAALFATNANACGLFGIGCKRATVGIVMHAVGVDKQIAAKKLGEAEQKAKDEQEKLAAKRKDLEQQKAQITSDLQALKDLENQTPEEQAALAKLEDTATMVLANHQRRLAILNTISRLFKSSDNQIKSISKLFDRAIESAAHADEKSSLKTVNDALMEKMKDLNDSATDCNETIDLYLTQLMNSSSDETLTLLVSNITIVNVYITDLQAKLNNQIAVLQSRATTVDAELASLRS